MHGASMLLNRRKNSNYLHATLQPTANVIRTRNGCAPPCPSIVLRHCTGKFLKFLPFRKRRAFVFCPPCKHQKFDGKDVAMVVRFFPTADLFHGCQARLGCRADAVDRLLRCRSQSPVQKKPRCWIKAVQRLRQSLKRVPSLGCRRRIHRAFAPPFEPLARLCDFVLAGFAHGFPRRIGSKTPDGGGLRMRATSLASSSKARRFSSMNSCRS